MLRLAADWARDHRSCAFGTHLALWREAWLGCTVGDDPAGTHLVPVLGVCPEVAVTGARDDQIAQVAARQRGRIARPQLQAIGVSRSAIRWLTARDRLFPLLRGVFAVGHPAPTELGDETAALLAAGDDAVLSGLSAALLWGLLPPTNGDGLSTSHSPVATVRRCPAFTSTAPAPSHPPTSGSATDCRSSARVRPVGHGRAGHRPAVRAGL